MYIENQTLVHEIFLLGFQNLQNMKIPLFSLFLMIYILTVWENILTIVLVSSSQNLQSPMYFFLQQLALTDLLVSSTVAPTLLNTIIHDGATMSLAGCITQFYFLVISERFECLLLAVMSYDRYVAICIPLRYTSIMSHRFCVKLIVISWAINLSPTIITISVITALKFCNQNTMNHFFCDLYPLLELSCSNVLFVKIDVFFMSIPVFFSPFILIIVSYICIARAILMIVSNTRRQKTFSTCSSHLAVVSIFYGTLIAIYMVPPKTHSQTISKVLSLLYTVVIPLLNPIIYSLRSKDIKEALKMQKLVEHP